MPDAPATFSESWYRVADLRLALRPAVRVQRQRFRGERWYVLQDPFTNQFFRLRPAAYEFVARLGPERSVEQAWKECLDRFPDDAPGQEAVIRLLGQLYQANLLQYPAAADTVQLFKRYERTRQREIRSRLLNVMFMRFPLLDPDQFLVRTLPWVGKAISRVGALVWLVTVGMALKLVADHFPALADQAQGILAPGNLLYLYGCLVILKAAHEFGHAYFCRQFGGEVHVLGIMLMIFTPVPYMDATSAWGFRERWKRILVGAAGMIVEFFMAAIATFVWAKTGPGIAHGVAYNLMFVASVSTLVFNLNPLLRFDGYYILADLLEIPNLNQRALGQLRYWAERYLFGLKREANPTARVREAVWLAGYGVASSIYRVIVFGGILLVVADRFLLIGLLMAAVCGIAWVAVPLVRLTSYLASNPRLDRHRIRAVSVSLLLLGGVFALLEWVPFPSHFRAPGVVRSREWSEIRNLAAGSVVRVVTPAGRGVERGQALLEMTSPELSLELAAARARLEEVEARRRQALQEAVPNLKPLDSLLESVTRQIARLEVDRASLTVRAPHGGVWVAPEVEQAVGRWLARGTPIGLVIDPTGFQFHATVRQEDGDRLFRHAPGAGEIRLYGESGVKVRAEPLHIIPAEQTELPSPALGWMAGGPIATRRDDQEGRRAAEPFFEVRGEMVGPVGSAWLHGRAGMMRFDLPPEPLLPRWMRSLRQMLQKRYQL